MHSQEAIKKFEAYINDWCFFARDFLRVNLDEEQENALRTIQHYPRVAIASGTSRGKDYLMAVAAICYLYLTPRWDGDKLVANTKVVLTGPTARQVNEIMMPEIARVFKNSVYLPGELSGNKIRTPYEEWFLTAFKADGTNTESWTGFHAVNMFFGVTEATGLPQLVYDAIEGNLQGNSRLVLVFNPNINHGYAANAMRSSSFQKIRLNSLNAPNVKAKRIVIPGQVDFDWVAQRISEWCTMVNEKDRLTAEGDFEFEGRWYRPNDLFRAKILGLFPKASEGQLIPREWVEAAVERYREFKREGFPIVKPLRLGVDVAGMGRDSSCFLNRYGDLVDKIKMVHSAGTANHMEVSGITLTLIKQDTDTFTGRYGQAFIDTIGEGAGVFSRLIELAEKPTHDYLKGKVHSVKFSEAAEEAGLPLKDHTGQYEFANMRAYLFWAVRDWLDPEKGSKAMLPLDDHLSEELTTIQWKFQSNGKIIIEPKEEIKKRLKRSPDKADALANTFYPVPDVDPRPKKTQNLSKFFH